VSRQTRLDLFRCVQWFSKTLNADWIKIVEGLEGKLRFEIVNYCNSC
jgi:hypothetical protein